MGYLPVYLLSLIIVLIFARFIEKKPEDKSLEVMLGLVPFVNTMLATTMIFCGIWYILDVYVVGNKR